MVRPFPGIQIKHILSSLIGMSPKVAVIKQLYTIYISMACCISQLMRRIHLQYRSLQIFISETKMKTTMKVCKEQ